MKTTDSSDKIIGPRGQNLLKAFSRDESGATAIEYGLIASLIIIAIIASVRTFSQNTSGMYTNIATTLVNG